MAEIIFFPRGRRSQRTEGRREYQVQGSSVLSPPVPLYLTAAVCLQVSRTIHCPSGSAGGGGRGPTGQNRGVWRSSQWMLLWVFPLSRCLPLLPLFRPTPSRDLMSTTSKPYNFLLGKKTNQRPSFANSLKFLGFLFQGCLHLSLLSHYGVKSMISVKGIPGFSDGKGK